MESDDDYESFSPPQQPSPPLHHRKLKRLKKSIHVANGVVSVEKSLESRDLESRRAHEAFGGENESNSGLGFDDVGDGCEKKMLDRSGGVGENELEGFGVENELSSGFGGRRFGGGREESKRDLGFDNLHGERSDWSGGEGENGAGLEMERVKEKRVNEGGLDGSEECDGGGDELNCAMDGVGVGGERKEAKRVLDFDDVGGRVEEKRVSEADLNESEECDDVGGDETNCGFDGVGFGEGRKETKRVLDFDDVGEGFEGKESDQSGGVEGSAADLKAGRREKKRVSEEDSSESKGNKKKKKSGKSDGDVVRPKTSSSNRRREEKERKIYLQQLHAESQRLLRETRDATFKPVPVVQKPISSVLEKIRQRKLEVLKKTISLQNKWSAAANNANLMEDKMDLDSEKVVAVEREVDISVEVVQEETIVCHADVESGVDVSHVDGTQEEARQSSDENTPSQLAVDEQSMHAFRAPVDDTQDLFGDSQSSEGKDTLYDDQNDSPTEEILAPSLLAMNLKFDSAPGDDISDDEEYNDKENIAPDRNDNGLSSPQGDPVKAFVDDEAVEEDDSDNDLMRFQEDEEDGDIEDYDELKDLIATGYDEKPIDNEMRNELHQKWLEQQDATGTDNLLQRLKFGSILKDTGLLDEDEEEGEDNEDDEEFGDEAVENNAKASVVRMNSRKAKQMIPHMFSDMNDGYLSDGEETERKLAKQRLLDKSEEQVTLLSPAKDESCREVFGLIKKLNIVPDAKKKAKTSSFFDKMLTGRSSNGSSKSSFLGRATSNSLPLSHKKGASTVRSFIFGRDDSNSRNSASISEDSSDVIPRENLPARNTVAKFSSSQSRVSIQSRKDPAEAVSGASLFEILKRSSMQSNVCNQDTTVGLTQTVYAAFKIPKKPVKIEGRS
ncbi:uncharacterized protein LOC131333992 [Rhododendron vialii]|uniref:uncharacterized protein LOC131333992 n=1 Tax=Rhododendron vialii TaxID=182163 RepID=UPI00265FA42C|nr:uncharacterized protein LOC131333992 [Rhododendron vialii]